MSWAAKRRFIILLIVGAVIAAFAAVIGIATFYKAPSCTDGLQNQGEQGVDCGGPCPYLCTALEQAPTVVFTDALPSANGRTSVIASVENKNADASAKAVPYTVTLYGAGQSLIQSVSGTLELPALATVPVFVPNITSGRQAVTSAFLTIDSSTINWYTARDTRIIPTVSNTTLGGTSSAPSIVATLTNPSVTQLNGVLVIVIVHNAAGNVIAASQTIVPTISAQGSAEATFTWNAPFPGVPSSIEVVPIIPLP